MRPSTVRSLSLLAPELDASLAFYTDVWGLEVVERDADSVWFRGRSTEPFIFSLHRGERRGVREVALALPSRAAVDEAAAALDASGISLHAAPGELDRPGGGYGLQVLDPDRRIIALVADVAEREAIDPPHDGWGVRPLELSHVVLNSPDVEGTLGWYEDALGLRVSDWLATIMVFLRGTGPEHHCVALSRGEWASLNHASFRVDDALDVLRGLGAVQRAGLEPMWGPGKHGPGEHVFCYVRDPNGYMVELTAERLEYGDDHEVSVHPLGPEFGDRLGLNPTPRDGARLVMAGEPDPGVAASVGDGVL